MIIISQVCVNEQTLNTAEKIVDRARGINQTSVNVFVYSKLLQGYCSSNQRKEAFGLLAVCTCPTETYLWGLNCFIVWSPGFPAHPLISISFYVTSKFLI